MNKDHCIQVAMIKENGYYNYPTCSSKKCHRAILNISLSNSSLTGCECSHNGRKSYKNECDNDGYCVCKENFKGKTCEECSRGFYDFPNCYGQ